jgi:hypothetical protein
MELSRSAGLTFGNRVVRYEQIRPLRQPLEITVVTVGVTGEYDDRAAYADMLKGWTVQDYALSTPAAAEAVIGLPPSHRASLAVAPQRNWAGATEQRQFSAAPSAALFTREQAQHPAEAVLMRGFSP